MHADLPRGVWKESVRTSAQASGGLRDGEVEDEMIVEGRRGEGDGSGVTANVVERGTAIVGGGNAVVVITVDSGGVSINVDIMVVIVVDIPRINAVTGDDSP